MKYMRRLCFFSPYQALTATIEQQETECKTYCSLSQLNSFVPCVWRFPTAAKVMVFVHQLNTLLDLADHQNIPGVELLEYWNANSLQLLSSCKEKYSPCCSLYTSHPSLIKLWLPINYSNLNTNINSWVGCIRELWWLALFLGHKQAIGSSQPASQYYPMTAVLHRNSSV